MSIDQKPRHRPFTEHSFPAGNMPDIIPTEQEKEIRLQLVMQTAREAFEEIDKLRQRLTDAIAERHDIALKLNDTEFNLANRTTERDVAWKEIDRLTDIIKDEIGLRREKDVQIELLEKDAYQIKRLSSSG